MPQSTLPHALRILLIGSGGREHALAWKLRQSERCAALFCAPGNAGTALEATNMPQLDVGDHAAVVRFCESENINLVVVGPEVPLVAGLADDVIAALPNVRVVGPGKAGAQLEGSKAFSKDFMAEFGIPTAAYQTFSAQTADAAKAFVRTMQPPYVLKADGLAAGKGVVIVDSAEAADAELDAMLGGKFGDASANVVIEQFLSGPEFSVFVVTDGKDYQLLPVARDYKRVGEGDTGPNTGGMGAVSPVPFADKYLMAKVRERIVEPTLAGLQSRGIDYHGIIFIGLIKVGDDPYVIEYNCRLGDPETQAIVPRIKSDLLRLFTSLFDGTLPDYELALDSRASCALVLASGGYPGPYAKDKVITGLDQLKQSRAFLAGVKRDAQNRLVSSGGRVLAIQSFGLSYPEAAHASKQSARSVEFEGAFFREDVGAR